MKNVGWDTETYLIRPPDQMIPAIVCSSWDMAEAGVSCVATRPEDIATGSESQGVSSTGDGYELWDGLLAMWQGAYDEIYRIIIHNASFDVAVVLRFCQDVLAGRRPGRQEQARWLYLLIWDVLEKSMDNEWRKIQTDWQEDRPTLVCCTLIREKLKNLSAHGGIEVFHGGQAQYGLANLVMHYFHENTFDAKVSMGGDGRIYDDQGKDITGTAQAGAAWRLRYSQLDGVPTGRWPQEAYNYALMDAVWARHVYEAQERKRNRYQYYSMNSESLQVYADVCLNLTTAHGFRIDPIQREKVSRQVNGRLEVLEAVLKDQGVIRANGSVNKSVVEDRVEAIWSYYDRQPLMTAGGETLDPRIATNKEVMEELSPFDPVLQLYAERQKLAKVRDAFLPNLQGDRVYTGFDILKETGRTSSRGSKRKKNRAPLYYSVNSQQMPRQPGIREIFLPDPGYVIVSVDYGTIELCSVGQVTYQLFGESVHRDMINRGYDLHSFLAASIAQKKRPALVDEWVHDREKAYQAFLGHRFDRIVDEDDSPEAERRRKLRNGADRYRDMAKPIGLGFPGGLSHKTLCVYAKTQYHVDINLEESKEFRDLWLETYPEMQKFFGWVKDQTDTTRTSKTDARYCYHTSGFFRFRSGATYCATANGASMQSLSADGGKRSVCWLGRACAGGLPEDNPYRILDACYPLSFIHDENLVAVPDDALLTERALAIEKLMVQAMQPHMPDVRLKAEPVAMRRWTKKAKPEWVLAPEEHEQAMALCARQYGIRTTNEVACDFRAKQQEYRLKPWDDYHPIPEMEI